MHCNMIGEALAIRSLLSRYPKRGQKGGSGLSESLPTFCRVIIELEPLQQLRTTR